MLALSEEKPGIVETLFAKRKLVMAMLSIPVFGMAIAVALILYKKPDNIAVVLGVILFVAVQYILMMYFWFRRLEGLVAKNQEAEEKEAEKPAEVQALVVGGEVLTPEEGRVFPVEDE